MLLEFAADYVRHRFTANTRHGTHSPFVYKLADEAVYVKGRPDLPQVEAVRARLLKDDRVIQTIDLGAGSHINKPGEKKVADIARGALKSPKLARLIYRIAEFYKVKQVVELGTCLGITTAYLSLLPGIERVISIEGCPETANIARENLMELGLDRTFVITGDFNAVLPELLMSGEQFDMVYIDGNHTYEATMAYFEAFLPHITESSLIIFDDIYWSDGMKKAWEEIKGHPAVTVTVDFFWIGLVMFRKGQAKEHFKLKV